MSRALRGSLARAVFSPELLARYPLFAALLSAVDPVPDASVRVMAVSLRGRRFRLHVNVGFFADHPETLVGVVQHELHHIAFGHLSLPKFRGVVHPDLMILACEMSANEPIREPLPGRPVRWEDYQALGMRPGLSTLEQYRILVTARAEGARISGCPGHRWLDDLLDDGLGSVYSPPTGNQAASAEHVARLLETTGGAGLPGSDLAGHWPGDLVEALREPNGAEATIDWRVALRLFVGSLRRRQLTRRIPPRRWPHRVGEIPGRARLPDISGQHVLVAIDTSGSMERKELEAIGAELLRVRQLARITVVECDRQIQRVYPLAGPLRDAKGRGGTDLRPIFAPRFLAEHRSDGVVYFTDGGGPYPEKKPSVPTLWVLTKGGDFACPWGARVCLATPGSRRERSGADAAP